MGALKLINLHDGEAADSNGVVLTIPASN